MYDCAVEVIDGRFEIVALAGVGGMAHVYRAIDYETHDDVAVKVVGRSEDHVRLESEIEALSQLSHPAIVRHVAHGHGDRGPYLVMQWLEGEDLQARVKRGPLPVMDTLAIAIRVASALLQVHGRGIVHRDVKPSNVLLVGGDPDNATLIDFGLARPAGLDTTEMGLCVGTPGYMAPEQILNAEVLGPADAFALGCLVYRCLHTATPFAAKKITAVLMRILHEAPTPLAVVSPTTPTALAELVDSMLTKEALGRPPLEHVLDTLVSMRATLSKLPPPPKRIEAVSVREQRIVSVVVATPPDVGETEATLRRAPGPPDVDMARLRAVAARFDASLVLLPNGAVVAVLTTRGTATDLAARAAQCALALELRLTDVPIVVATGRAELGAVPVGEAIDQAMAMVAQASPGAISVDRVTAALLDSRFEVAGGVLVRERSAIDAPRTLLGRRTTSVGRANDLARLVDAFEDTLETTTAHAALVVGTAGMGKSRLRHELTSEVQGQANVWIARGDPVRTSSPYGLIAPMLRAELGIAEGEPEHVRWDKLERAVASRFDGARTPVTLTRDEDARRITSFLGELLAVTSPQPDPRVIAAKHDPVLLADQVRRAFCDFLSLQLAARPLVMVLEDLHWADPSSVGLVTDALRALKRSPLFVVGLARPDVGERFRDLWLAQGVRTLRLSPLPAWAAVKLVKQLIDVSPEEAAELARRSEGNAFYLEELIRARAEGRVDRTPETIVAMAQSRLESLGAVERRVLRAASIVGTTFWQGAIDALLAGELHELPRTLGDLVAQEVIVQRPDGRFEGEFSFRHALVCEAAYSLLPDADRVNGHAIAAGWLREVGEKDPLVIAEHLEKGGDPGAAAPFYVAAARAALEANDTDGCIDRVRAAERCGVSGHDLATLRAIQAVAYRHHGDVALAITAGLEAVRTLPPDTDDWVDALAAVAVNVGAGGPDVLEDVKVEVARMFERGISARGGIAAALFVESLLRAGRNEDAGALLAKLASDPRLRADPITRATIDYASAVRALSTSLSEARDLLIKSVAAHEEAGNRRGATASQMNLAYTYMMLGRYDRAEELMQQARSVRLALGMNVLLIDHNLGLLVALIGRLDEGLAIEQRVVESAKAAGARMLEGFSRLYAAKIHRMREDIVMAEGEARLAIDLLGEIPGGLAAAWAELAALLLAQGKTAEALQASTTGMVIRESTGPLEEGDVLLQTVHAEALATAGDMASAREHARSALEHVEARCAGISDEESRALFRHVADNARAIAVATRLVATNRT